MVHNGIPFIFASCLGISKVLVNPEPHVTLEGSEWGGAMSTKTMTCHMRNRIKGDFKK